jgi:hypothetical protein
MASVSCRACNERRPLSSSSLVGRLSAPKRNTPDTKKITRLEMCASCYTVTSSRNHCCKGKATMSSLCIVEMHVTVNNTEIFYFAQQCFYGPFMSPETIACS